jgi:hypothetical protein
MRAPDRLESFDKGAPDSPLPFPDQGHQFANFIVRVVAVLFARDEHRQHHCGLPFGKLDRSPQPALPMTVNTRIGSEISREVDEVGSTNRRCPDAKSAPGGCTNGVYADVLPNGSGRNRKNALLCETILALGFRPSPRPGLGRPGAPRGQFGRSRAHSRSALDFGSSIAGSSRLHRRRCVCDVRYRAC